MKVWQLYFEVDLFDNLEPIEPWSVDKIQSFDGKTQKKAWKKEKVRRMEPQKKLKLGDAPGFDIPAFSKRAVRCLIPLVGDYVEFLPLESEEGEFFAVNIINVLEGAVDEDNSKIIRFDSGDVMTIEEFVFHENIVQGNPIFKIKELCVGNTQFVTEEFVNVVKENQLEGFCFELVWDSERLPNKNQYIVDFEKRVDVLPLQQREIIQKYNKISFPFLERIKENKKPSIQEGTIFAVRFAEKYCFGKVMCMQAKIPDISKDNFVVCFSDKITNNISEYPKHITMENLLLGPLFIREVFWKIGICYTVDYSPLTVGERNLDIGFFENSYNETIYNIKGEKVSYNPQVLMPCIESMLEDIEIGMITELMVRGLWQMEWMKR